jgi:Fe2+ transport system protein FeoA/Mn-dependent DtxR family transcriptional regulator
MKMVDLSCRFWAALFFFLAAVWLWTFLRHRRKAYAAGAFVSGLTYKSAEAEDVLKAAYALQETEETFSGEELARSMSLPGALAQEVSKALVAFGWAEENGQGKMHLTEEGEARARELIRTHRLWERYLVDRKRMPLEEVHAEAHRREHETTPEELERLDVEMGHPAWDPHGHPIPAPGYQVPAAPGRPMLEEGTPGSRLRIVCMDDEPAPLLAQLVVLGLKPGVDVKVLGREPDLMRLQLNGAVVPLANAAAMHISVVPAPALAVPLGELPVGSRTRVVEVSGSGKHQRRMLDMGLVPGAEVVVLREAPLDDPVEYRVKGTAISMRRTDANTVLVEEVTYG